MVGRMTRAGELKKRLSLGPRVTVDQHRLRPVPARPSAIDAVLAAMAKARVIGPRPIHLRRLAVVLLEPRAHFAGQLARIAQDLAPVVSPDPSIVVRPSEAMGGKLGWPDLCAGRRRD